MNIANNTSAAECAYIRSVLEDGKFELTSAYERGLFNAGQFYEAFKRLSDKFSEIGLEYGADKFKELFEITSASRFDPHWNIDSAVLIISNIWQYIEACADRLNFYEILRDMSADADN